MADNVIRRIIRLVLDKRSEDQVKKDSKGLASSVENTWKDAAKRIAGYLGAAFLIRKVIDFAKASVAAANQQEVALEGLRTSVENTGASFDAMESRIRAAASAMQDATTFGDEVYFESLAKLIALTGDVSASTNNMGLVANVASKFFKGQMAPAVELVSKVMNGQVTILQRMGIEVGSAQEGLQVLATRSFGDAEAKAQTFAGQMTQVNNLWGDFKEQIGEAITKGEGGISLFTALRAVIKTLSDVVKRNEKEIQQWVTDAFHFAIDAADVLFRAITGMANIIRGGFNTSIGIGAKALAFLTQGFAMALSAGARFQELTGQKSAADARAYADRVRDQADALHEWADAAIKAGSEQVGKGIDRLSTPVFTSGQFQGGPRRQRTPTVGSETPQVAAGLKTDEEEAIDKAMEAFIKAGERISVMQSILGEKFNATEAEIQRTTALLVAMVENGVTPADESFQALARQLSFLTQATSESDAALIAMNERLAQDAQIAAMTGVESFDMLQSQQQELARTMRLLITQGMDPQDARLQSLAKRYAEVTDAIDQQTAAMQFQSAAAGFLGEAMGAAMEGGIGPAAAIKSRQNKIEAAEMFVRAAGFALFGNPIGAAAALKQAGAHTILAGTWAALAASSKKPSGAASMGVPSTAGGGGSPGGGLISARQSSARSTSNARTPSAEVAIYMVGEGFDAVNPTVQRVVFGAQQNAQQLYGNNAKVRVIRQ